jgi:hypothetical protein
MFLNSTTLIIAVLLLCGLIFGVFVLHSWKNRRYFAGLVALLTSLVFGLSAVVVLLVFAGTAGYNALVHEELAATIYITPLGSRQFEARVVQPYSADTTFTVAGDELYIDARILKWKPGEISPHTIDERYVSPYDKDLDKQLSINELCRPVYRHRI